MKKLAGTALAVVLLTQHALAAVVIGTFDSTRSGDASVIDGGLTTGVRTSIAANFPGTSLVGTNALANDFLSSIDILFIHNVVDAESLSTALSISEQQALLDFVLSGKSAYIIASGYYAAAAQTFVTPFGMQVTGYTTGIDIGSVASHPVAVGPFGAITTFTTSFSGWFTDLGPYATSVATQSSNGQSSYAAIERNAIAPGSGRVILSANAAALADPHAIGGGFFPENETLILNSVDWLMPVSVVPEPTSLLIWSLLTIGVGCTAWWRRRKRSS